MNKIKEIDHLRGIAIIAVIAIHIAVQYYGVKEINKVVYVNMFIDNFAHFAVPLFILISGFGLAKHRINFNWLTFYSKRFQSIALPYLFASFGYFLFWFKLDNYNPPFGDLYTALITSNANYHFWYFIPLVQLYLFYPLIDRIYSFFEDRKLSGWFVIAVFFVQYYYVTFSSYNMYFTFYIFYFVLGIYFSRNYMKIRTVLLKKPWTIGSVALALHIVVVMYMMSLALSATTSQIKPLIESIGYSAIMVTLFLISYGLENKKSIITTCVSILGKYSFGIYLIHVIFIHFSIRILGNYGINYQWLKFYFISIPLVLIASLISTWLISYLPYSQYIVGTHNKINWNALQHNKPIKKVQPSQLSR